ncbi:MAG: tetratricopeptide repeat protein, partial [Thermoanaerobaculia bacterium]
MAPEALAYRSAYGYRLFWARRYEEAIAAFEAALALDPDATSPRYFIGRCLVELGRHGEARDTFAAARALSPEDLNLLGAEAYASAVAGRRAEAEAALAELERWVARGYPLSSQLAGLYT